MNRTEHEEIELLKSVVDYFAQSMKIKLIECAKKGKTGWDGEHPEHDLCRQIAYDAGLIRDHDAQGVDAGNTSVDIANRAMMIWYRHYGKALMQAD